MRRLQSDQGVDVVFNAADPQRRTFEAADRAAQVFVETRAPVGSTGDGLGAANPVVVEVVVGRSHGWTLTLSGAVASRKLPV